MGEIKSADYRDYVIRDGRLIGEFDQMYRNVADPWHCEAEAGSFKNDLLIAAVSRLASNVRQAFDVGCGLGGLTARLHQAVPHASWHACDVSDTAVAQASATVPGVRFVRHDLTTDPMLPVASESLDLIVMSEVMWYILPVLSDVLGHFRAALRPGGHLMVLQYFLGPGEQTYGTEYVRAPADLLRMVDRAGFALVHDVYLGQPPHGLLAIARVPAT